MKKLLIIALMFVGCDNSTEPEEQNNCDAKYAGYWSPKGAAYFETADCTGEYNEGLIAAQDYVLNDDCSMNYINGDSSIGFSTTWSSTSEYIITGTLVGSLNCIIYSDTLHICTYPSESSCWGVIATKQ